MVEAVTLPRFSGNGYASRLQRHGFEVIATGGGFTFGGTIVLATPGSDAVVKVGTYPAGDPWPLYAARCLQHPGPFKPMVRHLAWHGTGLSRFFVATMDRLTTPDWKDHQALLHALNGWYQGLIAAGIDYRQWQHGPTDPRWAKRLAKGLTRVGLKPLAGFVQGLADAFPSYMLDPQPSNWMVDSQGRLVLIDPFTRSPGDVPETASRLLK